MTPDILPLPTPALSQTPLPSSGPAIRYIKLGRGNMWAPRAFSQGEIPFGHGRLPHELALTADKTGLTAHDVGLGHTPGKASDFAREVFDFYHLDTETIWTTFADGHLWWARAEPEVVWLGEGTEHGERMRRTIGPWRNTNVRGEPC